MSDYFIIDDSTNTDDLWLAGGRGLDLTTRPEGFAYAGTADPFPDELLVPRADWQAIISERESLKLTNRHLLDASGWVVKDQQQTNFCWANGPTAATEHVGIFQGQPHVPLSSASVACPLTNFRNVGGWGKQALERIVSDGIVPMEKWPNTAIDRRYSTPENLEAARHFRVVEWCELEPRNLDHLVSSLLRGFTVPVGFNWWGHEVCAVDAKWIDGAIAIEIANSWGKGWKDNGYGILQGSRMLPDDAVFPRTRRAA